MAVTKVKYWVARYTFPNINNSVFEITAKTRNQARSAAKSLRKGSDTEVFGIYKVTEHTYSDNPDLIVKVMKKAR